MNLVLAHDYLIQMGGAERVVGAMHEAWPSAPIFTSAVRRDGLWQEFQDADIRTTWMRHLPGIEHPTHFKKYFPLFPAAFRSFGEIPADVAWISSSAFAKFARFSPQTRTVCYLHNTTRFLWQTDHYLEHEIRSSLANRIVRSILPHLRERDREATARMDVLIANSRNVQDRIRQCYGLESHVIPPPVETEKFAVSNREEGFHLIVSRLLGYKNIELPVRAFSRTRRRLVIIGDGPDRARLASLAGPTVTFLGRQNEATLHDHYARCRALVFPGEEDFGITPVEAMACGKPVVALAKGGALETVVEGATGTFFHESTEEALLDALNRCDAASWDPVAIRQHALQFSKAAFLEKMKPFLSFS